MAEAPSQVAQIEQSWQLSATQQMLLGWAVLPLQRSLGYTKDDLRDDINKFWNARGHKFPVSANYFYNILTKSNGRMAGHTVALFVGYLRQEKISALYCPSKSGGNIFFLGHTIGEALDFILMYKDEVLPPKNVKMNDFVSQSSIGEQKLAKTHFSLGDQQSSQTNSLGSNYRQRNTAKHLRRWGLVSVDHLPQKDAICRVALTDHGQTSQEGNSVVGFIQLDFEPVLDPESGLFISFKEARVSFDVTDSASIFLEFNEELRDPGKIVRNAIINLRGVTGDGEVRIYAEPGMLEREYFLHDEYLLKVRPREMLPENAFEFCVFLSVRLRESAFGALDGVELPDATVKSVIGTLISKRLEGEEISNGWVKIAAQVLAVCPIIDRDDYRDG